MNIGIVTNSLAKEGMSDLRDIAQWAVDNGLSEIEVGGSIPLDAQMFEDVLARDDIKNAPRIVSATPFNPVHMVKI